MLFAFDIKNFISASDKSTSFVGKFLTASNLSIILSSVSISF